MFDVKAGRFRKKVGEKGKNSVWTLDHWLHHCPVTNDWQVALYCAGFPCTPYSLLRGHDTQLLQEEAAKPLFECIRHMKQTQPGEACLWIQSNYSNISIRLPLCIHALTAIRLLKKWTKAGLLENVKGFSRVMPKVLEILADKLPAYLGYDDHGSNFPQLKKNVKTNCFYPKVWHCSSGTWRVPWCSKHGWWNISAWMVPVVF